MDLAPIVSMAAFNVLTRWDREVTQDSVDELTQELWAWYYDPRQRSTQDKVESAVADEIDDVKSGAYVRKTFEVRAVQILSQQVHDSNLDSGMVQYSSEDIKAELKGQGRSKFLRNLLPVALKELEATNPRYRESLRRRYDDGIIPTGNPESPLLARAHIALFQIITATVVAGQVADDRKMEASLRKSNTGHGDPTADMALSLLAAGDLEILIYNREGEIVDNTTLREEFLRDDFQMGATGRAGTDQDTLFDGMFMDIERGGMYRAQVFPELYPEEGRMLTENWPQEDLEAYCGGEHTVGYRRLSVVR